MKQMLIIFLMTLWLSPASAVEVNETAPDFALTDSKGQEHKLSSFKGKYVVLEWLNHECPFIKKHYNTNNMQNLQKTYTEKGVVWLSIISSAPGKQGHMTGKEAHKTTEQKKAHPTAVLLDSSGKVGKIYGAKTTPHMFIINPDGKLIYNGAIDDKPSVSKGSVEEAQNYISAALDASMAGKEIKVQKTKPYGCSVKYE